MYTKGKQRSHYVHWEAIGSFKCSTRSSLLNVMSMFSYRHMDCANFLMMFYIGLRPEINRDGDTR
jgi:hypothetical protein